MAQTRIGHVHLKVSDLDRAIEFYSGLLGFEVTMNYGSQAAFLSAGGYHHHIGLNMAKQGRRACTCKFGRTLSRGNSVSGEKRSGDDLQATLRG
ncbi:MAG: VOC family protein [Lascolabacillus sp.]|nr:VOC family protein [Lascolabacillus sp.]